METILGVCSTQREILVALAVDGSLVDFHTQRIEASLLLDGSEALVGILDRIARMLDEVNPSGVRILMPELTYKANYAKLAPRATMDTLVRLACIEKRVPVEVLARPTLRARLHLARKGSLESHVADVIGKPVGKYWSDGRALAALAAVAPN